MEAHDNYGRNVSIQSSSYINELKPLKRPLTALLFAGEEFRDRVKDGTKSITIREGWRDYRIGEKVILCCHILNWAVMGKLTKVNHCQLKDVPQSDFEADGFTSLEDAIASLATYYDGINENSLVTVIRWELV